MSEYKEDIEELCKTLDKIKRTESEGSKSLYRIIDISKEVARKVTPEDLKTALWFLRELEEWMDIISQCKTAEAEATSKYIKALNDITNRL